MKKVDFLEPTEPHILSELECNIISMFRSLNSKEKKILSKVLFNYLLEKADKEDKKPAVTKE